MNKTRTLFSRLFWSVAISEFIIFLFVGYFSYENVKSVLKDNNRQQSEALRNEISGLLDFQDFSILGVEKVLDNRLELASWELTEIYFSTSDSIETTDLYRAMEDLRLNPVTEFISIIRKDGFVVNSSADRNIGKNVFDFGKEFTEFIFEAFKNGVFVTQDFEVYSSDKELHKWSYQPTADGNYLVQIGVISKEGSALSDAVRNIITNIGRNNESLLSIDIYVNPHDPFSFASDADLHEDEKEMIKAIFKGKIGRVFEESVDERLLKIEYIYSERPGSNLYESLVVRIVKDQTIEKELLQTNLWKKAGLFTMGLMFLFVVLFFNANLITKPIRALSNAAKIIGSGNLKKRVEVEGNKEVRDLAESFNQMAIELQYSDQQIRRQKEKIEKAHKEIQSSIAYAKRIQTAILPPDRLVKEYLHESFILYKPKDVVAGDFYWMERSGDTLLFAAADCTGHGVPGAMISVMCHSALNRSVREYGLIKPSDVLGKTREIVLQEFEKSDDDMQDGMDVALCSLSGNILQFAGAQRPLFIVRGKEVIEIKGTKQPIGLYSRPEPFENHIIELHEGDSIYLFTDGVTDQFGGEKGKKFLSSRFKELLLSIQDISIHEQKQLIDERFDEWRGKEDQIDDVCIIGIRV